MLSKSYLRKVCFDSLDGLPEWLGNIISKIFFRIQSRKFVNEIDRVNKQYPVRAIENIATIKMPKHILIVRLDAIGDMCWTTAFFRELRSNFPDAVIDLIARPVGAAVIKNCPYLDNVFTYDSAIGKPDNPAEFPRKLEKAHDFMMRLLAKQKIAYDLCFLPREIFMGNGIDNLYLAACSGAKVRIGRAYATNRLEIVRSNSIAHFFNVFVPMTEPKNEVLQILDELKAVHCKINNDKPELWLNEEEQKWACEALKNFHITNEDILVAVGLEGSTPNRNWAFENFVQVFKQVKEYRGRNVRYVLLSGNKLTSQKAEMIQGLPHIIDFTGKTTIRECVALIADTNCYLGADTGLMHMAAALKKPVVEISAHFQDGRPMDSGSPKLVGAWGVPTIVLEPKTGLDGCVGFCTAEKPHCINQIKPENVSSALRKMLERVAN